MRRVCIDTMILSWGIKKKADPTQQHMIPWAEAFLRGLEKQETMILVPSVILHELLVPIPPDLYAEFLRRFTKGWMVVPYDLVAARWSAQVWAKNGPEYSGELARDHPELPFVRRTLKADCMIIGTALAQKANCIYSHDEKHVVRLAKDFIDVRQMDDNLELDLKVTDTEDDQNENENGEDNEG